MIRILSIIALAIVLALVGLQAFMRTPPVDAQFTCSGTTTDGQECACADSRAVMCDNFTQRTTACFQAANCPAIFKGPSQQYIPSFLPFNSHFIDTSTFSDTPNSLAVSVPDCVAPPFNPDGTAQGANCPGGGFFDIYIANNLPEVYLRYYFRFNPDVMINAYKIFEVHDRGFSNDQVFYGHFVFESRAVHIHSEGACLPSCAGDAHSPILSQNVGTPVLIQNNQWYCIEVHEVVNNPVGAANGTLEMWIDDQLKVRYTGIHQRTFGTPGVGFFRPTMSGRVINSGEATMHAHTRWLDRIVVANSRIGCSPATASAPNPPTNVSVTTP